MVCQGKAVNGQFYPASASPSATTASPSSEATTYHFEYGTTDREVMMPLSEKTDDKSIYFALILLPSHDGGPYRRWDGALPK